MSLYLNTLQQLGFSDFVPQEKGKGRISSLSSISRQLCKAHYDGYHPRMSRQLATALKRYINTRPKHERKTPEFVGEIRRKIFCLHEYNLQIAKVKSKYPRTEQFDSVLVQYVELECGLLYNSYKEVDTEHENNVTQRVLRLLKVVLHDALQNSEVPLKTTILACDKALLKIFANVRADCATENKLVANTIMKLLDKLSLLDEINKLKGKNIPFHQDTFLKDPLVCTIRQNLATSDYESGNNDDSDEDVEAIPVVDNMFGLAPQHQSKSTSSSKNFEASQHWLNSERNVSNSYLKGVQQATPDFVHQRYNSGIHNANSDNTFRSNFQDKTVNNVRQPIVQNNFVQKENLHTSYDSAFFNKSDVSRYRFKSDSPTSKLSPNLQKQFFPVNGNAIETNLNQSVNFSKNSLTEKNSEHIIGTHAGKGCGQRVDNSSVPLEVTYKQQEISPRIIDIKHDERIEPKKSRDVEEPQRFTNDTTIIKNNFSSPAGKEVIGVSPQICAISDSTHAEQIEPVINTETPIESFTIDVDALPDYKTEATIANLNTNIITIEIDDDDDGDFASGNQNGNESSHSIVNNSNLLQINEVKLEENEENQSPNFPVPNSDNNQNFLGSEKTPRNSSSTGFGKLQNNSNGSSVKEAKSSAILISDSEDENLEATCQENCTFPETVDANKQKSTLMETNEQDKSIDFNSSEKKPVTENVLIESIDEIFLQETRQTEAEKARPEASQDATVKSTVSCEPELHICSEESPEQEKDEDRDSAKIDSCIEDNTEGASKVDVPEQEKQTDEDMTSTEIEATKISGSDETIVESTTVNVEAANEVLQEEVDTCPDNGSSDKIEPSNEISVDEEVNQEIEMCHVAGNEEYKTQDTTSEVISEKVDEVANQEIETHSTEECNIVNEENEIEHSAEVVTTPEIDTSSIIVEPNQKIEIESSIEYDNFYREENEEQKIQNLTNTEIDSSSITVSESVEDATPVDLENVVEATETVEQIFIMNHEMNLASYQEEIIISNQNEDDSASESSVMSKLQLDNETESLEEPQMNNLPNDICSTVTKTTEGDAQRKIGEEQTENVHDAYESETLNVQPEQKEEVELEILNESEVYPISTCNVGSASQELDIVTSETADTNELAINEATELAVTTEPSFVEPFSNHEAEFDEKHKEPVNTTSADSLADNEVETCGEGEQPVDVTSCKLSTEAEEDKQPADPPVNLEQQEQFVHVTPGQLSTQAEEDEQSVDAPVNLELEQQEQSVVITSCQLSTQAEEDKQPVDAVVNNELEQQEQSIDVTSCKLSVQAEEDKQPVDVVVNNELEQQEQSVDITSCKLSTQAEEHKQPVDAVVNNEVEQREESVDLTSCKLSTQAEEDKQPVDAVVNNELEQQEQPVEAMPIGEIHESPEETPYPLPDPLSEVAIENQNTVECEFHVDPYPVEELQSIVSPVVPDPISEEASEYQNKETEIIEVSDKAIGETEPEDNCLSVNDTNAVQEKDDITEQQNHSAPEVTSENQVETTAELTACGNSSVENTRLNSNSEPEIENQMKQDNVEYVTEEICGVIDYSLNAQLPHKVDQFQQVCQPNLPIDNNSAEIPQPSAVSLDLSVKTDVTINSTVISTDLRIPDTISPQMDVKNIAIHEPSSLYTVPSALTEVEYSEYSPEKKVGCDLELLANIAADQETLAVKTDSEKEILDVASDSEKCSQLNVLQSTPKRRKSKVKFEPKKKVLAREVLPRAVKQFQKKHPVKQKTNIEEPENKKITTRNRSNKSKPETSLLKEIQKRPKVNRIEDPKYKPHDFISMENSTLPPRTNNVYAQKRLMETNTTSEDSNDSCESTLFIDLGENLKNAEKTVNSVYEEETICDMLEFVTTEYKTSVCISIPESHGTCTSDSFQILKQMEEFVDSNRLEMITEKIQEKREHIPDESISSKCDDTDTKLKIPELACEIENHVDEKSLLSECSDEKSLLPPCSDEKSETKSVRTTDHSIETILNRIPPNLEIAVSIGSELNKTDVVPITTETDVLLPASNSNEEPQNTVINEEPPSLIASELESKIVQEEEPPTSNEKVIDSNEVLGIVMNDTPIYKTESEEKLHEHEEILTEPENLTATKCDEISEKTIKTKAAVKSYEDRLRPNPYVLLQNYTVAIKPDVGIRTRSRSKSSEQLPQRISTERTRSSSVDTNSLSFSSDVTLNESTSSQDISMGESSLIGHFVDVVSTKAKMCKAKPEIIDKEKVPETPCALGGSDELASKPVASCVTDGQFVHEASTKVKSCKAKPEIMDKEKVPETPCALAISDDLTNKPVASGITELIGQFVHEVSTKAKLCKAKREIIDKEKVPKIPCALALSDDLTSKPVDSCITELIGQYVHEVSTKLCKAKREIIVDKEKVPETPVADITEPTSVTVVQEVVLESTAPVNESVAQDSLSDSKTEFEKPRESETAEDMELDTEHDVTPILSSNIEVSGKEITVLTENVNEVIVETETEKNVRDPESKHIENYQSQQDVEPQDLLMKSSVKTDKVSQFTKTMGEAKGRFLENTIKKMKEKIEESEKAKKEHTSQVPKEIESDTTSQESPEKNIVQKEGSTVVKDHTNNKKHNKRQVSEERKVGETIKTGDSYHKTRSSSKSGTLDKKTEQGVEKEKSINKSDRSRSSSKSRSTDKHKHHGDAESGRNRRSKSKSLEDKDKGGIESDRKRRSQSKSLEDKDKGNHSADEPNGHRKRRSRSSSKSKSVEGKSKSSSSDKSSSKHKSSESKEKSVHDDKKEHHKKSKSPPKSKSLEVKEKQSNVDRKKSVENEKIKDKNEESTNKTDMIKTQSKGAVGETSGTQNDKPKSVDVQQSNVDRKKSVENEKIKDKSEDLTNKTDVVKTQGKSPIGETSGNDKTKSIDVKQSNVDRKRSVDNEKIKEKSEESTSKTDVVKTQTKSAVGETVGTQKDKTKLVDVKQSNVDRTKSVDNEKIKDKSEESTNKTDVVKSSVGETLGMQNDGTKSVDVVDKSNETLAKVENSSSRTRSRRHTKTKKVPQDDKASDKGSNKQDGHKSKPHHSVKTNESTGKPNEKEKHRDMSRSKSKEKVQENVNKTTLDVEKQNDSSTKIDHSRSDKSRRSHSKEKTRSSSRTEKREKTPREKSKEDNKKGSERSESNKGGSGSSHKNKVKENEKQVNEEYKENDGKSVRSEKQVNSDVDVNKNNFMNRQGRIKTGLTINTTLLPSDQSATENITNRNSPKPPKIEIPKKRKYQESASDSIQIEPSKAFRKTSNTESSNDQLSTNSSKAKIQKTELEGEHQETPDTKVPNEPANSSKAKVRKTDPEGEHQETPDTKVPNEPANSSKAKVRKTDSEGEHQKTPDTKVPIEPTDSSTAKVRKTGPEDEHHNTPDTKIPNEPAKSSKAKIRKTDPEGEHQKSPDTKVPIEPTNTSTAKVRKTGPDDEHHNTPDTKVPNEPAKSSKAKIRKSDPEGEHQKTSDTKIPNELPNSSKAKVRKIDPKDVYLKTQDTKTPNDTEMPLKLPVTLSAVKVPEIVPQGEPHKTPDRQVQEKFPVRSPRATVEKNIHDEHHKVSTNNTEMKHKFKDSGSTLEDDKSNKTLTPKIKVEENLIPMTEKSDLHVSTADSLTYENFTNGIKINSVTLDKIPEEIVGSEYKSDVMVPVPSASKDKEGDKNVVDVTVRENLEKANLIEVTTASVHSEAPLKIVLPEKNIPITSSEPVYMNTVFSSSSEVINLITPTPIDSTVKHLPAPDLSLIPTASTSSIVDSITTTVVSMSCDVTRSVPMDSAPSCSTTVDQVFTFNGNEAVNRTNLNTSELFHSSIGLEDISPTKLPLGSNQSLDFISPSTSIAEMSNSMNLVQTLGTSSINFDVPDTSEIDQSNKQNFGPNFVTRVTEISCFVEKESNADHNYTLGDPLLGGNNEDKNILTTGLSLSNSPEEFQSNEGHLEDLSFNENNFIEENGTLEELGLLLPPCKKEKLDFDNMIDDTIPKPEDIQNSIKRLNMLVDGSQSGQQKTISVDSTIDHGSNTDCSVSLGIDYAVSKLLFLGGGEVTSQNNSFSTIPDIENISIMESNVLTGDSSKQTLDDSITEVGQNESNSVAPVCNSYPSFISSEANQKVVVEAVEQLSITSLDQLKKDYINDPCKSTEKHKSHNKTTNREVAVKSQLPYRPSKFATFLESVKRDASKTESPKVKDDMENYTVRRHNRTPVFPPKKKNITQQQHTKSLPVSKKGVELSFNSADNKTEILIDLGKERIRVKKDLIKPVENKVPLSSDSLSSLDYINEHDQNIASEVVLPFSKSTLEKKVDVQEKKIPEITPKQDVGTSKRARFDKMGNDYIMENILNVCTEQKTRKNLPQDIVKVSDKPVKNSEIVVDTTRKRKSPDNTDIKRDDKRQKIFDEEFDKLRNSTDKRPRNLDEIFDKLKSSVVRRPNNLDEKFDKLRNSSDKRPRNFDEEFDKLRNSTDTRPKNLDAEFDKLLDSSDKRPKNLDEEFDKLHNPTSKRPRNLDDEFDKLRSSSDKRPKNLDEVFDKLRNSVDHVKTRKCENQLPHRTNEQQTVVKKGSSQVTADLLKKRGYSITQDGYRKDRGTSSQFHESARYRDNVRHPYPDLDKKRYTEKRHLTVPTVETSVKKNLRNSGSSYSSKSDPCTTREYKSRDRRMSTEQANLFFPTSDKPDEARRGQDSYSWIDKFSGSGLFDNPADLFPTGSKRDETSSRK